MGQIMSTQPSTRRDPRYAIRSGSVVDFNSLGDGDLVSGALTSINVAGFAFRTDGDSHDYPTGTRLGRVTLTLSRCVITGDAVVRSAIAAADGRVEVGCLLYPIPHDEDRWLTIIAGVDAAIPPTGNFR